jgi:hypothetical protein
MDGRMVVAGVRTGGRMEAAPPCYYLPARRTRRQAGSRCVVVLLRCAVDAIIGVNDTDIIGFVFGIVRLFLF